MFTRMLTNLSVLMLSLQTPIALAIAPKYLEITNTTNYQSNAYVAGILPSSYPTQANSVGKTPWPLVRYICLNHMEGGLCAALIKMKTNTPKPVEIGTLKLNLDTGEVSPKRISANGFTIEVTGLGQAIISETS